MSKCPHCGTEYLKGEEVDIGVGFQQVTPDMPACACEEIEYMQEKEEGALLMQEKTLIVQVEGTEPIIVTIKPESVPSDLDYHTVLERWVCEKFDYPKYDYWEATTHTI